MAEITVNSEVTGTVWKVLVEVGQNVDEDEALMIIESMKMEIPVTAPEDGVVKKITVAEGDQIAQGDIVCVLEA